MLRTDIHTLQMEIFESCYLRLSPEVRVGWSGLYNLSFSGFVDTSRQLQVSMIYCVLDGLPSATLYTPVPPECPTTRFLHSSSAGESQAILWSWCMSLCLLPGKTFYSPEKRLKERCKLYLWVLYSVVPGEKRGSSGRSQPWSICYLNKNYVGYFYDCAALLTSSCQVRLLNPLHLPHQQCYPSLSVSAGTSWVL